MGLPSTSSKVILTTQTQPMPFKPSFQYTGHTRGQKGSRHDTMERPPAQTRLSEASTNQTVLLQETHPRRRTEPRIQDRLDNLNLLQSAGTGLAPCTSLIWQKALHPEGLKSSPSSCYWAQHSPFLHELPDRGDRGARSQVSVIRTFIFLHYLFCRNTKTTRYLEI